MTIKTINPEHVELLRFLRKKSNDAEANLWNTIAEKLGVPKHRRVSINISHMNRYSSNGETVIVPGKVLGAGDLDHKISVAAFSFSKRAKEKIEHAGGECLTIQTLVNRNPKGTGVKIIGD